MLGLSVPVSVLQVGVPLSGFLGLHLSSRNSRPCGAAATATGEGGQILPLVFFDRTGWGRFHAKKPFHERCRKTPGFVTGTRANRSPQILSVTNDFFSGSIRGRPVLRAALLPARLFHKDPATGKRRVPAQYRLPHFGVPAHHVIRWDNLFSYT